MKDQRLCALCDDPLDNHDTVFMNGDSGYICDAQMSLDQKKEAITAWIEKNLHENRNTDSSESL